MGILSLDYFKLQPSKLLEKTVSGAIISILTLLFVIWLIFTEVNSVMNGEVKSELLFENLHIDHIPVEFDIDIFGLPCEIIDLQFKSQGQYTNSVTKFDITGYSEPKFLNGTSEHKYASHESNRKMDEVYKAYQRGDGCKFIANIH